MLPIPVLRALLLAAEPYLQQAMATFDWICGGGASIAEMVFPRCYTTAEPRLQ